MNRNMSKPKIIISGINIVSGGILSVLEDCLMELKTMTNVYDVIVLVHSKSLFKKYEKNFTFIEYPLSKKSWFIRCFYEYIFFYFLSKKLQPYLWLSLNDMSPSVNAKKIAVYCQNAAPFYSLKVGEWLLDKKFTLFTWFYQYLYRINIYRNTHVIVQAQWMKQIFQSKYKGLGNIIVANPRMKDGNIFLQKEIRKSFIYPTFPRVFKNIELIGEALRPIDDLGINVYVTIDGTENAYAKKIVAKYGDLKSLSFIGQQSRTQIFGYYGKVSGLIFPSNLETWGMPLSEFMMTGKPIFVADKEYAYEPLAGYKKVKFFNSREAESLTEALKTFVCDGDFPYDIVEEKNSYKEKSISNWQELFKLLLK